MSENHARSEMLERVAAVGEVARRCADESEALRRLAPELADVLTESGLLAMFLPATYGGPGWSPGQVIEAVSALAHAYGAAGWCAGVASTTSSLAAFMEPDAARTVYPSAAVASGGVFAPNATGSVRDEGYVVSGRWQWGSGTQHASWIVGGARCSDGSVRTCFFRASDVEFHDTWHTSGLRGTGSLDFSVSDLYVDQSFTVPVGTATIHVDEPLARFPNFTLLSTVVGATGLGIARRALDEVAELAAGKRPQFSSRTLAESGFAQTEFARAEAILRSASAFLADEVGLAWDEAVAGSPVSVARRVAIRLAAAHAAAASVSAVEAVWKLAGGTAVYDTSVLGRCLRDVNVVTQHIMVAPKLNETLGRFYLGAEFDASMV